jgi:hypothetical protein
MSRPTARRRSLPLIASLRRAPTTVGRLAVPLILLASTLAACGGADPFAPKASLETTLDTLLVYPISTAATNLPAGVNLYGSQAVRPLVRTNLTLNFDFAVDLDATGRVRLLPPKLLVPSQSTSLAAGMQVVKNTTFDALGLAPKDGYNADSATVITPGQVVAIQSQGAGPVSNICAITAPLYAKLVVDSIRPVNGTQGIFLRMKVDPNCGFRSFADGLPSS